MTKDEALNLALEALDCICSPLHVREIEKIGNAMKAIREALAQPEQESDDLTIAYMAGLYDGKNTPQREWVGLTRDEVLDIEETETHPLAFYRAIEAKLKEKNT